MGTIRQYLDNILNARLGKDVRKSIHDAIEQTYEDASTKGNANMEVSEARETYETLNKRLNGDKSELQNQITNGLNNISDGTPLPASSINEMTDTTRIYVNTTNGHKYYYNGSNWVDFGVYQAESNPDVEDIKIGCDGNIYEKAGNSVRSQIDLIFDNFAGKKEITPVFNYGTSSYVGNNNQIWTSNNNKRCSSNFIGLPIGTTIKITPLNGYEVCTYLLPNKFYGSIGRQVSGGWLQSYSIITITDSYNCLLVTSKKNNDADFTGNERPFRIEIIYQSTIGVDDKRNFLGNKIDKKYFNHYAFNATSRSIANYGRNYPNRLMGKLYCNQGDVIIIDPKGMNFYVYESDENLTHELTPEFYKNTWIKEQYEYKVENNGIVHIIVRKEDDSNISTEDMIMDITHISSEKNNLFENSYEKSRGVNYTLEAGGITVTDFGTGVGVNYNGDASYQGSHKRTKNYIKMPDGMSFIMKRKTNDFLFRVFCYDEALALINYTTYDGNDKLISDKNVKFVRFVVEGASNFTDEDVANNFNIKFVGTKTIEPSKIRFATYNLAHYSHNNMNEIPTGTTEDAEEYRKVIREINADIWGLCEHNVDFNRAEHVKAKDVLWKYYKYYYTGAENGYMCNGLASKYRYETVSKVDFEHDFGNWNRYFLDFSINVDGKIIHVIVTHLNWQDFNTRHLQIEEIYERCQNYNYCIICGDLNPEVAENGIYPSDVPKNSYYKQDIELWKNYGFNVSNADFYGDINTLPKYENAPEGVYPWDNIITTDNIKIMKVGRVANPISDHYPFYADLVIY